MTAQGVRGAGYALEIECPRTGATTLESYISLAAVIARAVKLIQAGCNIGIWSAASLEGTSEDPIAANDDVLFDALNAPVIVPTGECPNGQERRVR